jgi:hypothetical protein
MWGHFYQGQSYNFQQPYRVCYPFDELHLNIRIILYLQQLWASLTTVFLVVGTDGLYYTTLTLLCINFAKLEDDFETLTTLEELKQCVEFHLQLIDLSKRLDKIFSVSILVNILIASFMICLSGIQATVKSF